MGAFDRGPARPTLYLGGGDEIRLLLCFTLYKIFRVRDAAVPLCFIYAKCISRQRDLCQAALVGIDQRMSDLRDGY